MITEVGQFAIALALIVALVQSVLPLVGAQRGDTALMATAGPAALGQALFLAVAFAALTHAFVTSDFSVAVVYHNSHSLKPMLYKVAGVWGNHEGSMLLWVLILAVFGSSVAIFGRNLPLAFKARALSVQAMISLAFLTFIVFTSNPFARLDPAPLDGTDLNPLLQDPGLAFHPPMLYLGYVGFSMAFSFAIAALIEGRVDATWARWVRPWTLAAWAFLTGGIALGSWWAYYELGWGGWWFWDPVENASFMPWLLGTALLHSALVVERRDTLKTWTILLAILTFSLSLLGTFLVRSGVLTSVHTFASDPERGIFILAILILSIGGSLTLFAIRAPTLRSGGLFSPVSRESSLVLNNLLLSIGCATVFIGTLYPLLIDTISGGTDKISVGPPFFNSTFVPLMVPMVLLMAVGPVLAWKRGEIRQALQRLRIAMVMAIASVILTFVLKPDGPWLAPLAIGLSTWLFVSALIQYTDRIKLFAVSIGESLRRLVGLPRAAHGLTLAHAGVAILIAGITGAAWQQEAIQLQRPGESVAVGVYTATLVAIEDGQGPNYTYERALLRVSLGDRAVATLAPERRFYPVAGMPTTEAAIRTSFLSDFYAVLGERDESGAWITRYYYNPLVPWIWIGALMAMFGGLVSLSDRRHRVGAPAPYRLDQTVAQAVP